MPTIDELIEWLGDLEARWNWSEHDVAPRQGIRIILEQLRDASVEGLMARNLMMGGALDALQDIQLEAIRAFVERVRARSFANGLDLQKNEITAIAIRDELTAMESKDVL